MDTQRLLAIYTNDHLAGSALGTALARRIQRSHRGPEAETTAEVAREIEEDRESLLQLMRRLGIRPKRTRQLIASAMERLGRLKPNGAVIRRSPLSRLVELEGMALGVTGKLALWRSLKQIAPQDPRLAEQEISRLIARAEDQRDTLEGLRLDAAREAFLRGETAHDPSPVASGKESG